MIFTDWIHRKRDAEIAQLRRELESEVFKRDAFEQANKSLAHKLDTLMRRVVLFEAAVGMPQGQIARVMAGKADHPLVVAVNQILAEELAEAQTVASDPRVQADTHRVAHALGAVDVCAQLRARINEMTAGKDGE